MSAKPTSPSSSDVHEPTSVASDGTDAVDALRVSQLTASESYREADRDLDFLHGAEARGIRLQLDFAKAEAILSANRVEHTIVVFGSTRTLAPTAARRGVDAVSQGSRTGPDGVESATRMANAERALANSRYHELAREFAQLVTEAAKPGGHRLVIMTGGGPGIMAAANRGASQANGPSVGLNITLARDQPPNPWISPALCFRFHYFGVRKLHFLLRARALVVFPGGYGTFDELFEALSLLQVGKIASMPVVLVGASFWRRAVDFEYLCSEGMIDSQDVDLFSVVDSADAAWAAIVQWYERRGESVPGLVPL